MKKKKIKISNVNILEVDNEGFIVFKQSRISKVANFAAIGVLALAVNKKDDALIHIDDVESLEIVKYIGGLRFIFHSKYYIHIVETMRLDSKRIQAQILDTPLKNVLLA